MIPVYGGGIVNSCLIYKQTLIKGAFASKGRYFTKSSQHLNTVVSPLITRFERWSNTKKKIFFENEIAMSQAGLCDLKLRDNAFASILSSPMRNESLARIRLPKDLLIQLKVKKIEGISDDLVPSEKQLEMKGSFPHRKSGKNSYVLNSEKILQKQINSYLRWIPVSIVSSPLITFSISDIQVDKQDLILDYRTQLEENVRRDLNMKLLEHSMHKISVEKNDFIIEFNENNDKLIDLTNNIIPGLKREILVFNVRFLRNWTQRDVKLVLKGSDDVELIKNIYKLITFVK